MRKEKYLEAQHFKKLQERAGFKGDKCFELRTPKYAVPDSINKANYTFLKS